MLPLEALILSRSISRCLYLSFNNIQQKFSREKKRKKIKEGKDHKLILNVCQAASKNLILFAFMTYWYKSK